MRKQILIASMMLIGGIVLAVRAAEPGKKSGATTHPTTHTTASRLILPYSKMTTLSEDQRSQIHEIHRKTLVQIHDINTKEEADILALLSDDQKKELHDIEEKAAADQKSKSPSTKKEE